MIKYSFNIGVFVDEKRKKKKKEYLQKSLVDLGL